MWLILLIMMPLPLYPPQVESIAYTVERRSPGEPVTSVTIKGKEIEIEYSISYNGRVYTGRGQENSPNTYGVTWRDRDGKVVGTGVYWFYKSADEFTLYGRYYHDDPGVGMLQEAYRIWKK